MPVSDLIPANAGKRAKTADLVEWFAVSEGTIRAWVRTGRIPPPARIGKRKTYWLVADLRAALKRIEEKENAILEGKRYG